ncbi:uncharacterized protein J4E79_005409 [Alternaria viburni]|uniref:uncharacterized protein n=1 Tax=Alternaria viburni TaxID=566460 RepID=UPI0020C3CC28|nr:uncharacterized protein J4E79_005409 [Alternaria viburni]KAI4660841.1 hypothetical protein J4E79_005409 [Alternaria viburni]
MSVVSVSTAAGLPVMRPDPSDSEAEQASGKKELEQGRKSGRLPKARDERHEKVKRPSRRTHQEEEYEESPLVYERQKVYDKYPPNWFRDEI